MTTFELSPRAKVLTNQLKLLRQEADELVSLWQASESYLIDLQEEVNQELAAIAAYDPLLAEDMRYAYDILERLFPLPESEVWQEEAFPFAIQAVLEVDQAARAKGWQWSGYFGTCLSPTQSLDPHLLGKRITAALNRLKIGG